MAVRRYAVLFKNAGEDGWGAHVPDLPGCTAAGKTMDETLRAIQHSIELWIEDAIEAGEEISAPSTEALSVSVAVQRESIA